PLKCPDMNEIKTRPATKVELVIPNDSHMMSQSTDSSPYILHDVLVDGHPGKAGVGALGTWSDRILLVFEHPHPKYGTEWATKYFLFDENKPGLVRWGHSGESFHLEIIENQS
ncbi:MAG: hypothetical protein VX655_03600, partial [Candidatus Thermoplasmatota archaeon]|nr:hypothetical protein [Candidatus Thermoplasmatota archaeon]